MKIWLSIVGILIIGAAGLYLYLNHSRKTEQKIICADCKQEPCICKQVNQIKEYKDHFFSSLVEGKKEAMWLNKSLVVKIGMSG